MNVNSSAFFQTHTKTTAAVKCKTQTLHSIGTQPVATAGLTTFLAQQSKS